jgi:hypothetical protein
MGTCNYCMRDSSEMVFTVDVKKEDVSKIICMQNIMRGYLERRKVVEFSKLKFAKNGIRGRNNTRGKVFHSK